jgi:hypothetical protein
MAIKDLVRDVVQAAADFDGRQLWKRFTNFDCFGVRVPDQNELMLGIVLGDAGEEFGLSLFRGQAAACLAALLDSDVPGDDMTEAMDLLGFSMDAFGDLPPAAQSLLREAGLHPRFTDRVPSFLVKRPGRNPRMPDESELTLLLRVLRAVVQADQGKLLEPATLEDRKGLCTLHLSGDPAAPRVSVTRERWLPQEAPPAAPAQPEAPDLSGLPRLDEVWLVGLPVIPGRIEGDDRSLQLLVVMDDASRFVLKGQALMAGELGKAVARLVETFRGNNLGGRKGLPREVVFSSQQLYDTMAPALRQAGVTCLFMPAIPKLQEFVAAFSDSIEKRGLPSDEETTASGAPDDKGPAPDDLAGWKAVNRRLGRRFADAMEFDDRLYSSRAAKRYFGRDDLDYFFKTHVALGVIAAYAAWGVLDYRPSRKSKTRAEEMLAKGLPEAQAMLLRARLEAPPTLYRVAGHDPKAGTVNLEDILLGGAVTVYDQIMSENIEDGVFVAARAFAAGRFHYIHMAGPPLGVGMGLEAVEFLQDCGMEFTRDDLRDGAHVFGWLWDWSEEWEANRKPPHVCNTDGDDMLWHTASFGVANPAEVRQALLRRKDMECDEVNDEFIWVKKTGRGAKMLGGPVTLGRIQFIGDELVLTVNSSERFAKARKWLERLPGVAFLNVTTRCMDEPDEDRPMDERIAKPEPVEITPEMAAGLQEMFYKRYMDWLDMRLPVLGGKTPRQACATAAGRQQVVMLIRTTPDPMGPVPIRVPREAMLLELGLAAETAPGMVLDPPMPLPLDFDWEALGEDEGTDGLPIVNSSPKIGRNDPCPCGSGKKYKKCCGR